MQLILQNSLFHHPSFSYFIIVKLLNCVQLFVTPWTPGSSIHGIFQARVLEQVAISFSKEFLDPGIEPTLQTDALPSEPPGKSNIIVECKALMDSYLARMKVMFPYLASLPTTSPFPSSLPFTLFLVLIHYFDHLNSLPQII